VVSKPLATLLPYPMQPQTIRIFLASSKELNSDRERFKLFIYEKSNRWKNRDISLEPVMWEDLAAFISQTRSQDEYNKAIKESDIFVMLYFTEVGDFTKEEFEIAINHFIKTGKIKIYTYFKNADIKSGDITREFQTVLDFKERLRELSHFHSVYTDTSDLLLQIDAQLDILFPYEKKEAEINKSSGLPRKLTNIPRHDDDIIGRDENIKELEEMLSTSKKVVLMNGLGGIGKTTLAKLYVQQYGQDYDHIAWIDVKSQDTGGESDMTISEAFVYNEVLSKNLGIEFTNETIDQKFNFIVNKLSGIQGKNLLVIDNARDDLNYNNIKSILPGPPYWKVIVTSRLMFDGFKEFEVEHLTEDYAVEFFRSLYKKKADEAEIKELLNEISYHTLTIEMLAKTLAFRGQKLTIKQATERLKNKQLDSPALQRKIKSAHANKPDETEIYIHLIQTFNLSPLPEYDKWLMKQFVFLLPRQYDISEIEHY
jgi:hypothetical protein